MDYSQHVGACSFCRSTNYHLTGEGFLVCEYGHQSQKFWEQEEMAGETSHGRRLRKPRTISKRSRLEEHQGDVNILKLGEVTRFNVLKGMQCVLQEQTEIVKRYFGLTDDDGTFEGGVKRLWLSFVSLCNINYEETDLNLEYKEGDFDLDLNFSLDSPTIPSSVVDSNNILHLPQNVSMTTLVVILYFGMLEVNLPVMLADIRRLITSGILPFSHTLYLIPNPLLRDINKAGVDILFHNEQYPVPYTQQMEHQARSIAYHLRTKMNINLKCIHLPGLLRRFTDELALPRAYEPMITVMLHKLDISLTYSVMNAHCLEVDILSTIVYFMKLHYYLDTPKKIHLQNHLFTMMRLPTADQLTTVWEARRSSVTVFTSVPVSDSFRWRDLDAYLDYCDSISLRRRRNVRSPEDSSYEELAVYTRNSDTAPSWQNTTLSQASLVQLQRMPKNWTLTNIDGIENIPYSYSILLSICSSLVEMPVTLLLKRISVLEKKSFGISFVMHPS